MTFKTLFFDLAIPILLGCSVGAYIATPTIVILRAFCVAIVLVIGLFVLEAHSGPMAPKLGTIYFKTFMITSLLAIIAADAVLLKEAGKDLLRYLNSK